MAASDYIKIKRDPTSLLTATEALTLLNVIRLGQQFHDGIAAIRAKMGHNFDDSVAENLIDWSNIEALYGLPPGNTSQGPNAIGKKIFTFIDGAGGSMTGQFQTDAIQKLIESVG